MYKQNEEDSNSKPIEKEQGTHNTLLSIAQKKVTTEPSEEKTLFTINGNEMEKERHIRKTTANISF